METIHSDELKKYTIQIHEPFAEFLMADPEEYRFALSLLDVVRFTGHACAAMVGAFLISKRAVRELFPETNTCIRGEVAVELPNAATHGATGPMSHVFSMVFGAWEKSGFGGLGGRQFVRRGLLKYEATGVPQGVFRFHNLRTGVQVDITYDPAKAQLPDLPENLPFQKVWRYRIEAILKNADKCVQASVIKSS